MDPIYFAAAGDIHGDHASLIEGLNTLIADLGDPLAFVLHVGDFEPVRGEADLATIAGPDHKRKLGDFHRVMRGELTYPAEVIFVGGNHEPYGWLEEYPDGGELIPGIYYLGRSGVVTRAGLQIAGLTGIHSPGRYDLPIPSGWALKKTTLKEPTYFRRPHVERLLDMGSVDILITHDWPSGHFGPFGNSQTRALLDTLQPRLHLAGHMHRPTRKEITHASGRKSLILGLNHVGYGRGDLVAFRWDGQELEEIAGKQG